MFLRLCRILHILRKGSVLLLHVLDLNLGQRTEFQRGLQRLTGVVRVDVRLDKVACVHDDDTVADRVQKRLKRIRRKADARFVDDKFGAVGEVDFLRVKAFKVGLGRRCVRCGRLDDAASGQHGLHAFQHGDVPFSACVDNAGLLEDGKHIGRAAQGCLRDFEHVREHFGHVAAALCRAHRSLCGQAGHSEDGAFRRFHDCFVSRLHAADKRVCERNRIRSPAALQADGNAAEEQREDYAGVAARASYKRVCRSGGYGAYGIVLRPGKLGLCRAHGQGHIGARIPVGNREDVEIINRLLVIFKIVGRGYKHIAQHLCGNFHSLFSLPYIFSESTKIFTSLTLIPVNSSTL